MTRKAALERLLRFRWRRRHLLLALGVAFLGVGSIAVGPLIIQAASGPRAVALVAAGTACLVGAIREWPR